MLKDTIEAYNEQAADYEERWSSYLEHTHTKFLDNIESTEHALLLDVSGGTGLLAEEILDREIPYLKFVVDDPSEGMIDIAKSRLPEGQAIAYTNFRADRLAFDKNSYDRLFCLNAFHHYKNQQQTLDIFYHILKPGGRLYLLDWDRSGFFVYVNKLIDWLTPEYIDTRSLEEMEDMLEKSCFSITKQESWRWRYWKFFFTEAQKPL
ncbi:MAG: class I SAM-dependent methyltransferase [Balneolaceae bacterium]|nr:class I SAM-dependent methyltransferase [Balneolaceae bacterium]